MTNTKNTNETKTYKCNMCGEEYSKYQKGGCDFCFGNLEKVEPQRITITGTRGRTDKTVTVEVRRQLGENDYVVTWTDGRVARVCGSKVWRCPGTKFQTLLTDCAIEA